MGHVDFCHPIDPTAELYEVLYVSTLGPDAPVTVVWHVVAKARNHNRELDITGLLVFDGMSFCEQMKGREANVLAQLTQIQADIRHCNLLVVYQGICAPLKRQHALFKLKLLHVA